MPTFGLVNRFRTTVTAALSSGSAGSTATVALASTSGLPSDGKVYLVVSEPVIGRRPVYKDTLGPFSSISGLTLLSCTRKLGTALAVGDVVECAMTAEAWDSLDSDFGAAAFDIIVDTAAELTAALASGNTGKRIWVKGGSYTITTQHLRPYEGQHIVWGGGGTGPVTVDFSTSAYWFKTYTESRKATLAGTSGATATITGSVTDDVAVVSSLPNEAGWRAHIGGESFDYTYASATTFTISPTPLQDFPTGGSYANSFYAHLTKGAPANVRMEGHLILKGTSGTGEGTTYPVAMLHGEGWDCSGLHLDCRVRGSTPGTYYSWFETALIRSRLGRVHVGADYAFTRTAAGTPNFPILINLQGQCTTIEQLSSDNVKLIDGNAADLTLTFLNCSNATQIIVLSIQASRLWIDDGGTAGTETIRGVVNGTPILGCKLAAGTMTAFRNTATLQTVASHASTLTGQWATTNGSASAVTYYP